MKLAQLVFITFCLFLRLASPVSAGEISVTDPWISEAPPGAEVLGAYMTINNHSPQAVTLVSFSSPDFSMIHLHQTTMHDGMAHMQKKSHLRIEPGGSVMLEPGGYHLMLMQPVRSLRAGDRVQLQLYLDNGQVVEVTAVVRGQEVD